MVDIFSFGEFPQFRDFPFHSFIPHLISILHEEESSNEILFLALQILNQFVVVSPSIARNISTVMTISKLLFFAQNSEHYQVSLLSLQLLLRVYHFCGESPFNLKFFFEILPKYSILSQIDFLNQLENELNDRICLEDCDVLDFLYKYSFSENSVISSKSIQCFRIIIHFIPLSDFSKHILHIIYSFLISIKNIPACIDTIRLLFDLLQENTIFDMFLNSPFDLEKLLYSHNSNDSSIFIYEFFKNCFTFNSIFKFSSKVSSFHPKVQLKTFPLFLKNGYQF